MKQLAGLLVMLLGFTFFYDATEKNGMVYINNASYSAVFLMYPGNHCVMFSEKHSPTTVKCTDLAEDLKKRHPKGLQPDSWIIPAEVPK